MNNLKRDREVVITEADKGGKVVVMDEDSYIENKYIVTG